MKKGVYKPTKQNIVIIEEFDEYCEILLDGEYKTVPLAEIELTTPTSKTVTLDKLKENIFINCINNPLSDILYSYNTNRLTPEAHQYKPLIKFLNSENSRVLIADEVGLGKTIEAGMIYKEIDKREELKISLIVVPSSLTYKWQEELHIRFDEHFSIYKTTQFLNFIDEVETFSSSKLINEKLIISYHTLRDERVMQKLQDSFFEVDFLIMDEAHTMRNRGTSTYQSAEIITALSEHIIFLSATPVQNSLEDLFNILSLLDNDYFKDYDYFTKMLQPNPLIHKLIAMIRNNHTLEEIQQLIAEKKESSLPQMLQEIFYEIGSTKSMTNTQKIEFIDKLTLSDHLSFIINRTKKKDVGLVTPRNAKSIVVDITQEERDYYDAVIELVKFLNPQTPQGFITIMPERMASSSMIASLESFKEIKESGKLFIKDIDDLEEYHEDVDIKKEAMGYLDAIIAKGQLIGENDSKFLRFEEILKDLKSQNIKQMILFSFFKKTLDYLEVKLISLGYSVGKIHGDFSIEERFVKIKEFKNGAFDILLSSEVGSEGLDMQFCNVVINYDLPWNPMRVEQRIGRIDRIGQKFDKLHIFNLCITGSIEDRILNRLYTKLDIFENSIGELEPILGEMESELNIAELMQLSQKELDAKLKLKELAFERKKSEISQQTQEFDKMLNEDLHYKEKEESLLNPLKVKVLQTQSEKIFTQFLEANGINYTKLKSNRVKLSSENLKKFFQLLKQKMSDKREEPLKYKEQRAVLQKIYRYKELKVSFETNDSDSLEVLYIYLNHPIISMITRESSRETPLNAVVSAKSYSEVYGVIYRADFQQLKPKSYIKTVLLDREFNYVDEVDYFEFIEQCEFGESSKSFAFDEVKRGVTKHIVNNLEMKKQEEERNQNRQIEIKINSINNYFKKQINKVKKLEQKVQQEDVKRMRIGEIENLISQRDKKVAELESKKRVSSSFEILGIVGVE